MIIIIKKRNIILAFTALAVILVVGCFYFNNAFSRTDIGQNQKDTTAKRQQNANKNITASSASQNDSQSIIYKNTQYGFTFTLPGNWKNYTIVDSKWEGIAIEGPQAGTVIATGPIISIRHPQWTDKIPRQDIPIMVFTIAQWTSLNQGVFHIGAAPIEPRELGRNNSYVFALPARYNFAFLPGYQEVETILESNPLKTTLVTVDNNLK